MTTTTSLLLNGLCLAVFVGVYPEEQEKKRNINIDLHIRFQAPPPGCHSDQLQDTYCYDQIIAYIKDKLGDRKYKLIEYLSREIHGFLKEYFPPATLISVRVTKQPNIPDLSRGVTFEYGDETVSWSF